MIVNQALADSINVMRQYFSGKAELGQVLDAVRHIRYVCLRADVRQALDDFCRGLCTADPAGCLELLGQIELKIADWNIIMASKIADAVNMNQAGTDQYGQTQKQHSGF